MKKYQMTCSCGMNMTVDANSKEEAVEMFKGMMTEDKVKEHMTNEPKHAGQPIPSMDQVNMMIMQTTQEVPAAM